MRTGLFLTKKQSALSTLGLQILSTSSTHFSCSVTVKYLGKAAHASAFPWDGVNALDAAVLCYQNVSCLRQQFKPDWRVSGIYITIVIYIVILLYI